MDSKLSWAASEFDGGNLLDKRICNRLVKIADDLSKAPLAPINQASGDWAATKAAYRFFNNDRVTEDFIISSHISKTSERIKNHNLIFALQDTSVIDYSSHAKAEGLGTIGAREHCKGLIMHTTLAWSPANIPLGLLTQKIASRPEKAINSEITTKHRSDIIVEEKESYKWIDALEKTVERTPEGCSVITICDREGDFYEMFLSALDLETDLVIRSCQDRNIEIDGEMIVGCQLKSATF